MIISLVFVFNSIIHSREQEQKIAQLESELKNQEQQVNFDKSETEDISSEYIDGVYEGEANGYGGSIVMQVVIKDGILAEANVVSAEMEDDAYFDAAKAVIDDILKNQTTDNIDTISGATFSSGGIINAMTDALRKAERS